MLSRVSSAKIRTVENHLYLDIRDQDQGRQQKADLTSGSTCHSDMQVVKFMVYHQITPLAEPESRQDPRSTWTVLWCRGGLHLTGYSRYMAFLVLLTGNTTGFLEMECTSWIFFPVTTSITRPWMDHGSWWFSVGEPWQRFGLQLGCCSAESSQDWPRVTIKEDNVNGLISGKALFCSGDIGDICLMRVYWYLMILGMLTKFEGTAASTWPLVTTTGFSKHPRHEGSKLGKHRGKNDQFTHGYHLPTMSWSNPVPTSIHPQFHAAPTWTSSGLSSLPGRGKSSSDTEASFLQRFSPLHVSSAHLCWSLLKWGSCLSSLLVVPPWTRHLCRPYQTASDSLAIPAHTRWPNMAKQRNGVSEIICCAERDEKERVKSQHDSKLDCKLDWRAPDDELSLGWPELLESAFPILPAPCCSLQKKSQPCKASHLCTWCGDRNSCDHKKWQNFRLIVHSCIDIIREYVFDFFLIGKNVPSHLQQHKLQEKECRQSSMRLWNILWSMYSGRPRSVQRFSTWSRQAEDLLYFNRSRNKHSLINTTGIAGRQKTQQKLLPRILIFCEVHPKNTQGMPESCSRKSRWFGEVFEHGICGGQNLVEQCGVGLENEDTKRFQEISRDPEVRVIGLMRKKAGSC